MGGLKYSRTPVTRTTGVDWKIQFSVLKIDTR